MKVKRKVVPATPRGIKHLPATTDAEGLANFHRKPPTGKHILLPSVEEVHNMSAEHLSLWMSVTSEMNRALRLERARQLAVTAGHTEMERVEGNTRDAVLVYVYDKYSDYTPF